MLRLRHCHAITRNDHDLFGIGEEFSGFLWVDRADLSLILATAGRRGTGTGTEAPGDHREESAIHRTTHDVTEDRAAGSDQRAGHDEQIIGQHEAGGRRRPAGVAVQHRDDDRHIRATDRHHHVDTENQRDDRHDDQRIEPTTRS